jgi:C-terminal processing protease CtpA/Prc
MWLFRGGQVIDDQAYDQAGRQLPIEVLVKAVAPNTYSARSGMRPGDQVIRLDGQLVRHIPHLTDLYRMGFKENQPFKVSILRDGKELELLGYPIAPEVELEHRVGKLK